MGVRQLLTCPSANKDGVQADTVLRQPIELLERMVKVAIALKPLEDKIIIKQAPAETTTASGLVIPDSAKEKPQQGEVLAVGPGRRDDKGERVPMDVKEGDRVLYSKYGGTEVTYKGEDYLIVSARDILAVLE